MVLLGTREGVGAGRAFLRRAMRHLALSKGVSQFPDIGGGIRAQGTTYEVA
ncbi:SAM-dependent methyltransferase [Sphaerisporangium sp. NPDC004334]